jgi:pimeloyl-ACP methyl ester carboxylesterase
MQRILTLTLLLAAPAAARDTARAPAPSTPDARPLVWVVDGAGDLRGCSTALGKANVAAGNPVELAAFPWSHGFRRVLIDQIDLPHAKTQGARLAARIRERQAAEPGRRVVVVAHSAGCAVALAAGECLPPDSVDRVLLLAPSVSTEYDIRPALRAAREGMDVYCSKKDRLALGVGVRMVGTTDRFLGAAAGLHGFKMPGGPVQDLEATRLRQHFWSAEMARTGHTGGHYGVHAPAFITAYLFPAFGVRAEPEPSKTPPAPTVTVRTEYRPR